MKKYPEETQKVSAKLTCAIVSSAILPFLGVLTETMLNVIFPDLMREFEIDAASVQWVTSVCLLVMSVVVPVSAFMKKRFTFATVFLISTFSAIIGGFIAMWSPNFAVLLFARALQGISTGIGIPLMYNIILQYSPRSRIGFLSGLGSLVIGMAPAFGPAFGGFIVSIMPWRMSFAVIVAMFAVNCIVGKLSIENRPADKNARISFVQFSLVALGLVSFTQGVQFAGKAVERAFLNDVSARDILLAVACPCAGIAFFALFWFFASRSSNAMINVKVFKFRSVIFASASCIFLQIVELGLSFTVPYLSQQGYGFSSFKAGLIMLPGALAGSAAALYAGRLLDRKGPLIPVSAGLALMLVSLFYQAISAFSLTFSFLIIAHIVVETGYCGTYTNVFTVGLWNLPEELKSDGNAALNTFQQLGCTLGTGILASVMSSCQICGMNSGMSASDSVKFGGRVGYSVMIFAVLLAAVFAAMLIFSDKKRHILSVKKIETA